MKNIKEIEQYLNDLDNLLDTVHFAKESIKDYTHYHKDLTLKEFVLKGRELIRKHLMNKKGLNITLYMKSPIHRT